MAAPRLACRGVSPTSFPPPAILPPAPASVRAARLGLARSPTAQIPTRLALARWTAGGNLPHLAASPTPPLRPPWFARAQRDARRSPGTRS